MAKRIDNLWGTALLTSVLCLLVWRERALYKTLDVDGLLAAAREQSRPRRWPWQPKTVRDRVGERSAELAELAAERSAELAALAAARRDVLLQEARRQSQPRHWPWQPKTVRDRLGERGAAFKSVAADQLTSAAGQAQQVGPVVQEAAGRAASRLKD